MIRACSMLALACTFCVPIVWAAQSKPPKIHTSLPCRVIHGRARLYIGDGNLRIWHIGTHHEFEPADPASWNKLEHILLPHGMKLDANGHLVMYELYADFTLCPTKPYRKGWVQPATVKRIQHEYRVRWPTLTDKKTSKPKPKSKTSSPCSKSNTATTNKRTAPPATKTAHSPLPAGESHP